jgi:hypothetical protein
MSYNQIFHFIQNAIPRLDFIYVLPSALIATDTRMGVSRFAHVHFICEMWAGPFRASSFEPATAFKAETCSRTVEFAFIPSVAMVKPDMRKTIANFYRRRSQVPHLPWWRENQLNLVRDFTRC